VKDSPVIRLQDALTRHPEMRFDAPLNWTLKTGEHWAIIGPNGAGKSLFVDVLTGKLAIRSGLREYPLLEEHKLNLSESIRSIAFRDISSIIPDYNQSAYQQRWNSQEAESSPDAGELFRFHPDQTYANSILDSLDIRALLNRKMIHLSSGELRKFLIARTLITKPRVLILDNPFIGLDAPSRDRLSLVLEGLSKMDGLQLIFVLSNPTDLPGFVHLVLPILARKLQSPMEKKAFLADEDLLKKLFPNFSSGIEDRPLRTYTSESFVVAEQLPDSVVRLNDINIRYGSRSILKGLSWSIQKGERWALLGPNGAGKSTLLSLLCADNPQSYANDIRLFGFKRGSGESIWDIKQHIGYVSPEMHHYYMKNVPCQDIVGSGLFDTIGLYRKCNETQLQMVVRWMNTFGIGALAQKNFLQVSSGEQRLCLLARAFIKEPQLLILDEPLHGLDASNKSLVRNIINDYCSDPEKTLIYVTHYTNEIPDCVQKQFQLSKTPSED
jgi:molybdate transport system ATP-binding protein